MRGRRRTVKDPVGTRTVRQPSMYNTSTSELSDATGQRHIFIGCTCQVVHARQWLWLLCIYCAGTPFSPNAMCFHEFVSIWQVRLRWSVEASWPSKFCINIKKYYIQTFGACASVRGVAASFSISIVCDKLDKDRSINRGQDRHNRSAMLSKLETP